MKIFHNDTEILDIQVDDNSYRYRAIKGDHNLTLYFSLAEHVEIPVGAYCVFQNETYTLEKPESLKMQHSRKFEYTVIFDSPQAKAGKWKFRNPVDRRLKFSLTATPREHLQMFVDNMNQRDSGWTIGQCIDGPEKVISYNHAYCIDALAQIADEYETEYEFVGKQVSLWKVEYNRDNPLSLAYGKGNGFKPGIGRSNFENSTPIEILYVQGGAQNLDPSRYGSPELLLPKNQTIWFDGVHFENENGFDASKAKTYTTDANGFSIRRADKPLLSQAEDSLDCSEIYPKRIGTISQVVEVDTAKHFYDIVDKDIPSSLNFGDCLIEGETMTIIPQTGMLAGKEFEVKYVHDAKGSKAARRFEIVPQEIDGMTMPGGGFVPKVGDTYAVFHCMLPAAYICDDATKTGASWNMFREGVKYLYDNEEQKFSFTGELDGAWAKRDWNNIGGRIRLGGFVRFSDERFQPEGVLVRIIGIKDYINDPHSPEIELSNSTVGRTVASDLRKIESNEVVVEDKHREALQFTKRRYRDSLESIEMLKDAMLENFTESISPLAVQTMMMLIGDESLQFQFVDNMTTPTPVAHNVAYDQASKVLTVQAGIIQHLTLGIDTISASRAASEYTFWKLPAFETPPLTESGQRYYLYAKVSTDDQTGIFHISDRAIGMDSIEGFHHLLMGILNSEYDNDRSFVSLYGFTEILPGRITTDKIVSSDGKTYFDLSRGEIGGMITFGGGSSGLRNLSEWNTAQLQIDQAGKAASNAEQKANTAQQAAQQAQDAIKDAQREITGLKDFTDQTFADGVVDRAEAASIQKYINNISQTRKQVDTTYTAVYENKLLSDEGKQNLQIAKLSFDRNITVLQDAITAAVADGVATQDERAAVDTAYADFIRTYGVFNARIEEANTYIQTAINTTAQGAYTLSSQMLEVLNTVTSVLIPDLQEQVDGSIMTWEGSDAPTLHNYPANQWTNEMERKRHTGDYYDRYQTIDGKEVTERYKFSFRNNTYQWVRVADSEAALAFSEARAALGLAGTKSAISYSPVRPPVPYSVNDVWFRTVGSGASMTMTIHICNVNRTSEEIGSDADWQMVDDTQVRMRAMSSDSIISREEKASLRNTLLQMEQNAHSLRDDAAQYGVGATEVQNAFNTLQSFLRDTVLIGSDTDTTLTEAQRTAYNRYFADFETATSRVGTLVADVLAQQKVNDLQISSVNRIADEYLLRWNDTAPDITTEGSDEDGHYFKIDYAKLYHAVGGGDRFLSIFPELQFEAGRQYGFKIRWKNPQDSPAMAFRIDYTDGTKDQVDLYTVFQKVTVGQVVTRAGKTVQKISVSYFESGYAYIYAICLVEGNKLPQDWPVSPIDVQSRIDTAKRTAQAAQETADTAQQTAQAATTTLTTWASDSYISPQEKTALRQQRKDIQAEYGEITAQAAKYGVSTAVFTSAYDAADTALAKYTAATPESIPVEADYAQIAAYYTARGVILDAIAAAAKAYSKKLVDEVQPVGDNLLTHTKDFTQGWTGAAQSAGEALGGLTVYTAAATQANIDMRQQNNITLLPATVYTLSFWAKGRGTLATFVYPSVNEEITATNGNNAGYEGSDTFNSYTLTADWKRFWVTFRTFTEAKTGNVLFRAMKGGEASVCGAKLAQGNKGIVWTESPADLDEKIEAAKIAADNLGYLKTVFAEDNTIISGGAVVGSFLGVKTSTETVFAGMSGKNFLTGQDFTPDDMSCPWLFGGASSAMEANSAKFRVYPGGAVAMSALIAGDGCHIGGFKIANNALFNEYDATINGISYYSSVGLYATGLIDIRKAMGNGDLTYLYIGFYELLKMKDGRIPAISLTASNRYHAGMLLDVPAGASAVEIKSGCIRGFRRSMRYTANSMTLTALDDVIVANNSGAIVITLPPAPQDGEEFEILKNTSSAQITISGNGKQIVSFGVSIANAQVLSAGEDYAIRLTYSSTLGKWFLQKSNGKLT